MKAKVLFSSGKDSSLAAILLEPFFDVELVTINFGIVPTFDIARESAKKLGFSCIEKVLDSSCIVEAASMLIEDGSPGRAINHLHNSALEAVCSEPDTKIVADGTRRDDKVPMLTISEVRSLEDRHKIKYIRPLMGYGRSAVDALAAAHLQIIQGESDEVEKADYEVELRSFIRKQYIEGDSIVDSLFPKHIQSHVINKKKISQNHNNNNNNNGVII